jgi:hypothetical protein
VRDESLLAVIAEGEDGDQQVERQSDRIGGAEPAQRWSSMPFD